MTIKTNHHDQYANDNIADFLYSEYSSSISFQEDFRYLSLGYHEDELRGAILNEYTPQSPFDENLRKWNRKADKRARISRYTRAIFALTSTPVPRKQTHGSLFQKGHESFLLYAYGPLFEKGKYWHDNPKGRACVCCVLLIVVMTHRMRAVRALCSAVTSASRNAFPNLLQKSAAHRMQHIFVRQIARKPQPPIARLIVDFS